MRFTHDHNSLFNICNFTWDTEYCTGHKEASVARLTLSWSSYDLEQVGWLPWLQLPSPQCKGAASTWVTVGCAMVPELKGVKYPELALGLSGYATKISFIRQDFSKIMGFLG